MAYTVARRTRDIGIRIAIGPVRNDALWLVMREVLIFLGIDIAIALPAAWILTHSVRSQLYGIQPADPMSITLATVAIAGLAILVGYLPPDRATRVDPIHALRYE